MDYGLALLLITGGVIIGVLAHSFFVWLVRKCEENIVVFRTYPQFNDPNGDVTEGAYRSPFNDPDGVVIKRG